MVLHSNIDTIKTVQIIRKGVEGASGDVILSDNDFNLEPQYHFLKVNVAEALEVGVDYILFVAYSSTMNEGPMKRGIWRGYYTDKNNVER